MAGRWKEGGGRRGVTLPERVARGTAMKRSWRRPLLYSGAYVLIGWIARARNSLQPPVGHFNRRDRSFRVFAGVKTLPPHPLDVGWTAGRTGRYSYLVRAGERASTTPPLTRGPKTPMFSRCSHVERRGWDLWAFRMNTELVMSTEREANVLNSHNTSQEEKHRKRGHVVVRQVSLLTEY